MFVTLEIMLSFEFTMLSKKYEFEYSSTGPDLKKGKRMQAVKKDIISGHVCYAGRTLTWSDKGDKKKKADKKKSILSTIAGVSSNGGCSGKIDNATAIAQGMNRIIGSRCIVGLLLWIITLAFSF